MKPEYAKRRPPVLFTWEESACYFAVNPDRVTALELMGEATSEFFATYSEAVKQDTDILCFPEKDFYTDCHFFELLEFPGLILELGPGGIFQIHDKKRVGVLRESDSGFLYWESIDDRRTHIPASRVVYFCRPIEMSFAH